MGGNADGGQGGNADSGQAVMGKNVASFAEGFPINGNSYKVPSGRFRSGV